MGIWYWLTVKRSKKNPFIKIPKEVLEELKTDELGGLYVIVTNDREKFERMLEFTR